VGNALGTAGEEFGELFGVVFGVLFKTTDLTAVGVTGDFGGGARGTFWMSERVPANLVWSEEEYGFVLLKMRKDDDEDPIKRHRNEVYTHCERVTTTKRKKKRLLTRWKRPAGVWIGR